MIENTNNQQNLEQKVDKDMPKEDKKEKATKTRQKPIITTREYTNEELTDLIRKKYSVHNKYFKVLEDIVNKILEKEVKEIDKTIGEIETIANKIEKMSLDDLKKYLMKVTILNYRLNDKLNNKGLQMEISSYLNNLEISEKIFEQVGGTEKERLRAAEYNSMVSTFTSLINARVYYVLKNKIDCACKIADAIKKVLSAEIQEMQTFRNDLSK